MWFFMNSCYLMSFLTFVLLLISFVQGIFNFHIFKANHLTFMVLTSIIYLLTETLVIFFFVGTGVSIKEYTLEHKLKNDFHRRSIGIKRRLYPPLLFNMLLMLILFIMVGAVDTYRVSAWIYYAFFIVCVCHFLKTKLIENKCFRENTQLILEMSGITPSF